MSFVRGGFEGWPERLCILYCSCVAVGFVLVLVDCLLEFCGFVTWFGGM